MPSTTVTQCPYKGTGELLVGAGRSHAPPGSRLDLSRSDHREPTDRRAGRLLQRARRPDHRRCATGAAAVRHGRGEVGPTASRRDRRRGGHDVAMGDTVLYDLADHVATITYNRPEALNAVNRELRDDLNAAFARFRDDDEAWVAIVTGAGRAFCVGADLRDGEGSTGTFAGSFWEKPTLNSFESGWEIFKPVIAAVNGYCLGYGLTLVTWCDFVLAGETRRVRLPRGAARRAGDRRRHPAAAAPRLARRHGAAPDRRPDRRRAGREMGLVGRVVPDRDLLDEARRLADRLIEGRAPGATGHEGGGHADPRDAHRSRPSASARRCARSRRPPTTPPKAAGPRRSDALRCGPAAEPTGAPAGSGRAPAARGGSPAGDGGDDRELGAGGDGRREAVEIPDVVGADEEVDVHPRRGPARRGRGVPAGGARRPGCRGPHPPSPPCRRPRGRRVTSSTTELAPATSDPQRGRDPDEDLHRRVSPRRRGPHRQHRRQVLGEELPRVAVVDRAVDLAGAGPEVEAGRVLPVGGERRRGAP